MAFVTPANEVAFLDMRFPGEWDGAVVINADFLLPALEANGLTAVWIFGAEKDVAVLAAGLASIGAKKLTDGRSAACGGNPMGPGKDLCGPHQVDGTKKPLDEVGVLHLDTNFFNRINPIPPVQPPSVKTFPFSPDPNQIHNSRHPVPREGRSPSSRTLGWDAVDAAASGAQGIAGRASVCERSTGAQTNGAASGFINASADVHMPAKPLGEDGSRTAKPCGPGTRCWCQVGGGFGQPDRARQDLQSADDGDKTNSSPGRARHKPLKPSACGNAG